MGVSSQFFTKKFFTFSIRGDFMADTSTASAFRQRAGRLGYRDIKIKKDSFWEGYYHVELVEPLAGVHISFFCSEEKLKKLLSQRALKK